MQTVALFIDGSTASATVDVSAHHNGFVVQFDGIAGSGTYKIQASCDGGTTWTDITKSFVDLSAGTLLSGDVAANTIAVIQVPLPGLIRLLSTHSGTGTPTAIIGSHGLS